MKLLFSAGAAVMLVFSAATTAVAQATVIRPDRRLTPAETELRSALYQLRDSLATLSGAAARMDRDFARTSPPALVSRARQVQLGCEAAARNIPDPEAKVRSHPMRTELEAKQQAQLLKAYTELDQALTACSKTFGAMAKPGAGEEVRGYGNARIRSLNVELKRYGRAADDFFSALRIPNRPLGAGPNPFNNG